MEQVYESGSDFEEKTLVYFPENFNCSNDKNKLDNRSGKKGPEAESVVTGVVGDKTYAFIGLEMAVSWFMISQILPRLHL